MKSLINKEQLKQLLKENKTTNEIAKLLGFERVNYLRNRLSYLGISLYDLKLEITKEYLDQGFKEKQLAELLDIDRVTIYSRKKELKKREQEQSKGK